MLDIRAVAYSAPLSEVDFAPVTLTVQLVNVADETGLVSGTFRIYNGSTGLLIHTSDIVPVSMPAGAAVEASALTNWDPPGPAVDTYFVVFDGHAFNVLVPAGINFALGAFYFDVKPVGMGPAPAAHHATHEVGGSDEMLLTGMSGLLTTPQTPAAHAASHELGGSDPIDLTSLPGLLADEQTPLAHFHDKHPGIYLFSEIANATTNMALPWLASAINSATISSGGGGFASHPTTGYCISSISANSGIYLHLATGSDCILIAGTETTSLIFQIPNLTNTKLRFGFHDANTSADPVDGCYIQISNVGGTDGTLDGRTSNNSARSTTPSSYVISGSTWYVIKVKVNPDASQVDFYLYDEDGTLLWTDSLSTNIPTARNTDHGVTVTNSGTTALLIFAIDFINLAITRALPGRNVLD